MPNKGKSKSIGPTIPIIASDEQRRTLFAVLEAEKPDMTITDDIVADLVSSTGLTGKWIRNWWQRQKRNAKDRMQREQEEDDKAKLRTVKTKTKAKINAQARAEENSDSDTDYDEPPAKRARICNASPASEKSSVPSSPTLLSTNPDDIFIPDPSPPGQQLQFRFQARVPPNALPLQYQQIQAQNQVHLSHQQLNRYPYQQRLDHAPQYPQLPIRQPQMTQCQCQQLSNVNYQLLNQCPDQYHSNVLQHHHMLTPNLTARPSQSFNCFHPQMNNAHTFYDCSSMTPSGLGFDCGGYSNTAAFHPHHHQQQQQQVSFQPDYNTPMMGSPNLDGQQLANAQYGTSELTMLATKEQQDAEMVTQWLLALEEEKANSSW